jgi:hypothetical protein
MSRRHGPPARVAMTAGAAAITAGAAAVLARAGYATLRRRPPGGAAVWARTNHRGEAVTLLEGPAAALGATLASALAPGLSPRGRAALAAAGAGAAAFGGYDDLAGSGGRRGFRGHLGALAGGEVTTGAVKIGGIGATGMVAAALIGGRPADVIINAGLTAGGANLLNLFDLRGPRHARWRWRTRASPRPVGRMRPGRWPARPVRPSPCSRRIWASGRCSATRAPMPSAPCSGPPRRRACPGRPG